LCLISNAAPAGYTSWRFDADTGRTCLKNLEEGLISDIFHEGRARLQGELSGFIAPRYSDEHWSCCSSNPTDDRDLLSLKDFGNIRPDLFERPIKLKH
jgi:hypothetical protein